MLIQQSMLCVSVSNNINKGFSFFHTDYHVEINKMICYFLTLILRVLPGCCGLASDLFCG